MTDSELEDISDWERGRESSGTRTGSWVFDPRTRRMGLVKVPKHHPKSDFEEGETWAEVFASRLGRHLGLPVPEVEPVRWRGRICPLSWNICPAGWELREGVGLATSAEMKEPLLVSDVIRLLEHHLGRHDAAAGVTRLISFDILIGNCDRHWYNWGVLLPAIVLPENQPVMAHFYDNGSSLGANLMPDRLRRYIADTAQQDRFDRNFKYEMRINMDVKPSPRELLTPHLLGRPQPRSIWTSRGTYQDESRDDRCCRRSSTSLAGGPGTG